MAPASDTAVTYVRQKGHWYQFRMKLEEKGPTTAKDERNGNFTEVQVTVDPSLHSHPSTTGEMQFGVPVNR